MDIAAAGMTIIQVSAVCLVLLLFGAVAVKLFGSWFVDQALSCGEAMTLAVGLLIMVSGVMLLWGSVAMILPPLIGGGAFGWFTIYLRRVEKHNEAIHWLDEEDKARALLARDATATVGLERLATALEKQGRRDEALAILRQWQAREPWNKDAVLRLNRLRPAEEPVVQAAPPPPEHPVTPLREARDLGGVSLDEMLGRSTPPPPPPRELSEDELLQAFSEEAPRSLEPDQLNLAFDPDSSQTDDDGPDFGGSGVDDDLRPSDED